MRIIRELVANLFYVDLFVESLRFAAVEIDRLSHALSPFVRCKLSGL
jgi:hypothetical protein